MIFVVIFGIRVIQWYFIIRCSFILFFMECILYNTIISHHWCIGRGGGVIDYHLSDINIFHPLIPSILVTIWHTSHCHLAASGITRKRRLRQEFYAVFVYIIAQPHPFRTKQMCRGNNLWTSWSRWLLARDIAWQAAASWSILWPLTFCLQPKMHYISFTRLSSVTSCTISFIMLWFRALSPDTVRWVNVTL